MCKLLQKTIYKTCRIRASDSRQDWQWVFKPRRVVTVSAQLHNPSNQEAAEQPWEVFWYNRLLPLTFKVSTYQLQTKDGSKLLGESPTSNTVMKSCPLCTPNQRFLQLQSSPRAETLQQPLNPASQKQPARAAPRQAKERSKC